MGAILEQLVAIHHPSRFPRLMLVEDGDRGWTPATAATFAKGGGESVVLACGTEPCLVGTRAAEQTLRAGGVEVVVVHAPNAGHGFREIRDHASAKLDWLPDGDPCWSSEPIHPIE